MHVTRRRAAQLSAAALGSLAWPARALESGETEVHVV